MKFASVASVLLLSGTATTHAAFNRIATWFACSQLESNCNIDDETSAEVIWRTKDFNTLVYTDSPGERVGFIDITDASAPSASGYVHLPGEPTCVRVVGDYGEFVADLFLSCVDSGEISPLTSVVSSLSHSGCWSEHFS
jgi:hypothetical protein